jgi:hypothetical protein
MTDHFSCSAMQNFYFDLLKELMAYSYQQTERYIWESGRDGVSSAAKTQGLHKIISQ